MKTTYCTRLLGSAPTLEDIQKVIHDFYCGTKVNLTTSARNEWSIANSIRTIPNVRVIFKGNRYRFESTATA